MCEDWTRNKTVPGHYLHETVWCTHETNLGGVEVSLAQPEGCNHAIVAIQRLRLPGAGVIAHRRSVATPLSDLAIPSSWARKRGAKAVVGQTVFLYIVLFV